ncbi:Hsp70 family protein [Micromonospora sp. CPCC 206061]|uniref:Hsp70 family protein n=1 Tax=Micromonospora sp. CPCC 206061 TaxID=3122410 RepID=UPI002FF32DE9
MVSSQERHTETTTPRPQWRTTGVGRGASPHRRGYSSNGVPLDVEAPFRRDRLDELAGPILDSTVSAARAALVDVDIQTADLSDLYLAGGSSRMLSLELEECTCTGDTLTVSAN